MSGVVCPGGIRTSLDRAWGLDGREQPKASSQALQVVPLQDLFRLAQLGSRFRPGPASPHPQVKVQARSCLPPPPGCYQRGWLSWSSPAGAVPQGSGGALCQGHQEKVGFSGCIQPLLFVMSLTPRGSWRCGSRAGCPGPESRPSHSCLPGLARTREPPVLPPERPSHRPALSPSCSQAPCPCRGRCRRLRGGSEDPAHTSTGSWAPSTWQGQERPCWNQPRWKSLQVEDEVTALGTLTGRLPWQGGVPCSCRAGRL